MANISVKITQNPDKTQLRVRVKAMQRKMADFKRVHFEVSNFLDKWVQENFNTQGGKVGGWAPFKRGGRWVTGVGLDRSAKLLQDTGRLRLSILPFHTKRTAGVGSKLDYFKIHEFGIGVPVRRMLPKSKDVRANVLKMFRTHVRRAGK